MKFEYIWNILSFLLGTIITYYYHISELKKHKNSNINNLIDTISQMLKNISNKTVDGQYNPDLRIDYSLFCGQLSFLSKLDSQKNFNSEFQDELGDIFLYATDNPANKNKVNNAVQTIITRLHLYKR